MSKIFSADTIGSIGVEEMESLKEQANKLFSEGKFNQSVIGYTYAINQLATVILPSQRRAMVNMDSAAQVSQAIRDCKVSPKSKTLATALFNNRSAAYLKMSRFEKAALDAGAAATLDPENFKAWLRKATAHKELGQWYEANQAAKQALRLDANSQDIQAIMEESQFKMSAAAPQAFIPEPVPVHRKRFGVF